MDVSIVIPIYNALPLARPCLASVFEHGAAAKFEVILVDNGSTPDVEAWAAEQKALHGNLTYLRYSEPLGFARSVNAGAAVATGDVLVILNSDTLVTAHWMDDLHAALMEDPSLGALSPYTNHAGEPAQMDFGTIDLPAAKALALVAKRPRKPELFYLPQCITFFCVAVRRKTWEEFNGLDEAYKVGNFEDDDLCMRLRVAGYRLAVARHAFVYHHNNATFTANKISHGGWMSRNAATFADHARRFAEADPVETDSRRRWPRRPLSEVSVVILAGDGSLGRTLRSLSNQTITDFEIIEPGSGKPPGGAWIAYLQQGDIAYPFHLEALHDALDRNGQEAIYADGWVVGGDAPGAHPDAARQIRKSPLLLPGWMHHSSLHPDAVYDETMPMHWPRITWEMQQRPAVETEVVRLRDRVPGPIEMARDFYRKLLPLETRHSIDRRIRQILGRPLPDPDVRQMERLAAHLRNLTANGIDAGAFAVDNTLPAVFMFNAISWNNLTQRQHHFARGLADAGHQVFWIETMLMPGRNWQASRRLQGIAPNVHMLRLPSTARDVYTLEWNEATIDAMAAALQQTCAAYGIQQAVALVNYPRWQPLVCRMREAYGWKIASDCLDDQRALAGIYQTTIFTYEDWLFTHADVLLTSSVILQSKLHARPCILLHNACDFELFSSATSMGYLADRSRPIVGFFGALANWLDFDLIHAAAERFPDWTFVFIGPPVFSHTDIEVQWMRAIDHPNIVVLPQMDLRVLATHLADFDICIMPFKDMEATHSMNPVKLYEYAAAGKPIVARDLPETRHLVDTEAAGLISLYRTPTEFFAMLEQAANETDPFLRERRQAFARDNDWERRITVLSRLLIELAATAEPETFSQ